MKEAVSQRIYLFVMAFSGFVMSVLIISMALDQPIGIKSASIHTPPGIGMGTPVQAEKLPLFTYPQIESAVTESKRITAEGLKGELKDYLPKSFPFEQVDITIEQGGRVSFAAELTKKSVKQYIDDAGVRLNLRQNVVFKLMPDRIAAEAVFLFEEGSDGGMLVIVPEKISLNGTEIGVEEIPSGFFDEIASSVNRLITAGGFYYRSIAFEDGAMVLVP